VLLARSSEAKYPAGAQQAWTYRFREGRPSAFCLLKTLMEIRKREGLLVIVEVFLNLDGVSRTARSTCTSGLPVLSKPHRRAPVVPMEITKTVILYPPTKQLVRCELLPANQ
jgi:hypothetical protein